MKFSHILTSGLFSLIFTHSHAAEILWVAKSYPVKGNAGSELSSGIFDQSGKLILAENSGGPATTFNGIDFKAGDISFGDIWEEYHFKDQTLSKTGTWSDSNKQSVVQLKELTPGKTYRIQALIFDGRDEETIIGKTVRFDDRNQGIYANSQTNITWGNGLLVTGSFVADATTQNFTIETFSPNGGASESGQLNALLVHETSSSTQKTAPIISSSATKPNSTTVLGLGGLTIILKTKE